jgi:hyperosmotically inducible periplasmic protein
MMRKLLKLVSLTFVLSNATAMAADSVTHDASSSAMRGVVTEKSDNTEMNTRDKNGDTLTPQKQTNSDSDLEVLAAVRRAIVDDDNLSTSAHNVKIMVMNGVVTLRGPVNNENEKARIQELTHTVAGVVSIDNQLDIDTN